MKLVAIMVLLTLSGCASAEVKAATENTTPEEFAPTTGHYVCTNSRQEKGDDFDLAVNYKNYKPLHQPAGVFSWKSDSETGQNFIPITWVSGPFVKFNQSFYSENEAGEKFISLVTSNFDNGQSTQTCHLDNN